MDFGSVLAANTVDAPNEKIIINTKKIIFSFFYVLKS